MTHCVPGSCDNCGLPPTPSLDHILFFTSPGNSAFAVSNPTIICSLRAIKLSFVTIFTVKFYICLCVLPTCTLKKGRKHADFPHHHIHFTCGLNNDLSSRCTMEWLRSWERKWLAQHHILNGRDGKRTQVPWHLAWASFPVLHLCMEWGICTTWNLLMPPKPFILLIFLLRISWRILVLFLPVYYAKHHRQRDSL